MASVHPFEAEITALVDVPKKKGESRQDYLSKLWAAADDLTEANWKKLSEECQTWANDCTDADKAKEDLPEFPKISAKDEDDEEKDDPAADAEDSKSEDDEDEKPAPKTRANKKPPAKEAKSKTKETKTSTKNSAKADPPKKGASKTATKVSSKKPAEEKSTSEGKGFNVQGMVRKAMIKDMGISMEKLQSQIEKKVGASVSTTTIRASRSWFKAACRDLKEAGCLKNLEI